MSVKLQILQYNVVSKWGKEDIEWKYQLRLGGLTLSFLLLTLLQDGLFVPCEQAWVQFV